MSNSLKRFAMLLVAGLTALASTPQIGDRAPQFRLPSADGRTVALGDYTGKKLVLVFYRGYW